MEPIIKDSLGDEFWPLSGKPYFHIMIGKSHVKPMYQMVVPAKMYPLLPYALIPAVLTYGDKKWETQYHGDHRSHRRFSNNWKAFVDDNNLKIGDACVFELMERTSKILKFRVQILRGDIPPKFLENASGESVCTPIIIE